MPPPPPNILISSPHLGDYTLLQSNESESDIIDNMSTNSNAKTDPKACDDDDSINLEEGGGGGEREQRVVLTEEDVRSVLKMSRVELLLTCSRTK
jgi:hypothetical protein